MSEKILIFQELRDRFSVLVADLEKLEISFESFSSVEGLPEAVTRTRPGVLVLPSHIGDRPLLSPLEELRSVLAESPRILMIGRDETAAEEARALGFAEVLVEPVTEVRLLEVLLALARSEESPGLREPPEETRRVAARVRFSAPVTYVFRGKQSEGWGINASRSGLFFAAAEEIPPESPLVFRFDLPGGKTFDVGAASVRSEALETPEQGRPFGVGVRFLRLSEPQRDRLDLLLETYGLEEARKLTPEFVTELVEHGERVLSEALKREINPAGLAIYLKEIGPFERAAFAGEGDVSEMIRRMVALRMQCYALRIYLPAVKADRRGLGPRILPVLKTVIDRADGLEADVEAWVKDALHEGDEAGRQELNASANRLYEAKTKLLYTVDDVLGATSSAEEGAEIIRGISDRVRALQKLRDELAERTALYRRRAVSAAAKKPEPRPAEKPAPRVSSGAPAAGVWKIGALVAAAGLLLIFWRWNAASVSISELGVPFRVKSAAIDKESLVVRVDWNVWRNLPKSARDEMMRNVEKILYAHGLRQAKVLDESGRVLALTLSADTPAGVRFQKRYISH